MGLLAIGVFPYMLPAIGDAKNGLSIYQSASSPKTLKIMAIIAVIGMPLVLAYTVSIYWVFRGKVKLEGGVIESG